MFDQLSSQTQFSLHHMRRASICFTLGVALTLLSACGTTQSAQNTTVATSPSTTTTITTDLTTTSTTSIVALPTTVTPVTTKAPATTNAKKKTTATTQVPQMQLTGTPQEQANQVVAALAKVAASSDFGTYSNRMYQLKQSVAPYGITIEEDPLHTGQRIYRISKDGQSGCFLWTFRDELEPSSCS